ncbi:hypothetical protein KJ782_00245 [Patescibacteria group bacterium]|nr:hypothetical protein [Patescibacteria group bacterium]
MDAEELKMLEKACPLASISEMWHRSKSETIGLGLLILAVGGFLGLFVAKNVGPL